MRSITIQTLILMFVLGPPSAHGVILFLDVGDTSNGVQAGPLNNANPQIQVLPGQTFSLHLWGIADTDNAKVIAALGHDISISGTAASAITSTAYTLDNSNLSGAPRWTQVSLAGGLNGSGLLVDDQRAVFVPTAAPFVGGLGSANLGVDPQFDPASGAVRLARLDIQIDPQATLGTSAELRLAVSDFLIASVTTAVPSDEPLFLGYSPAGPEPATGSGSVVGATSTIADATITIATFGDGDGDGDIDLDDYAGLNNCFSGPASAAALGCELFDQDADGDVDLSDFNSFQIVFAQP